MVRTALAWVLGGGVCSAATQHRAGGSLLRRVVEHGSTEHDAPILDWNPDSLELEDKGASLSTARLSTVRRFVNETSPSVQHCIVSAFGGRQRHRSEPPQAWRWSAAQWIGWRCAAGTRVGVKGNAMMNLSCGGFLKAGSCESLEFSAHSEFIPVASVCSRRACHQCVLCVRVSHATYPNALRVSGPCLPLTPSDRSQCPKGNLSYGGFPSVAWWWDSQLWVSSERKVIRKISATGDFCIDQSTTLVSSLSN